jgi:hypothetical protein
VGLDIVAYRRCTFVESMTKLCHEGKCEHCDDDYLRHYYPNAPVFAHNSPGFREGVYRVSFTHDNSPDCFHFRAGSYSSYNLWREWICQFATGHNHIEFVCGGVQLESEPPFWKLLNMSDCEGIITGPIAEELLKDFEDHREKALAWEATKPVVQKDWTTGVHEEEVDFDPECWAENYDLWTQAFRIASPEGILLFC